MNLSLNERAYALADQMAADAEAYGVVVQTLANGTRPDERRQTSSVSINGVNDVLNNQLVDGMDNNERTIGTVAITRAPKRPKKPVSTGPKRNSAKVNTRRHRASSSAASTPDRTRTKTSFCPGMRTIGCPRCA